MTRIHALATENPSYGYRLVTALLKREGWTVNPKRVYRLWRQAGPSHRPAARKQRRLGGSENSCVRLKPTSPGHVWSYDFLYDATDDGRRLKWMPVIDEYTRECLTLEVDRSLTSTDGIGVLDRLIAEHGAPDFVRSDKGPECIAEAVQKHLAGRDVDTRFIEPGAPWENGYVESFNGTLREDLLNREVFGHRLESRVLGEQYRTRYNTERPHSSLDDRTPAEFAASYAASSALTTTVLDEHSLWYRNRGHLTTVLDSSLVECFGYRDNIIRLGKMHGAETYDESYKVLDSISAEVMRVYRLTGAGTMRSYVHTSGTVKFTICGKHTVVYRADTTRDSGGGEIT